MVLFMYVETVPNRSSPPAILLRESYWDKTLRKSRKRTLANLSKLPPGLIEEIRACVDGKSARDLSDAFTVTAALPHGHVAATLGTLRKLELETLIHPRPSRRRDLVVAMIIARIIDPKSKLATAQGLSRASLTDTLADGLDIAGTDANELYGAMDWLLARQPEIEKRLAARHIEENALVLWDLTSVWMEGRRCPLARFGHSRDGKTGKLQVEFGLLCDRDGRPVAVEVFDGNTSDPATVATVVSRVRDRFGLKRVVVVGDRGMLTEARIREDIQPAGLDWISALRAPALRKLVDAGAFQPSLFDDRDMAEITCEAQYPGERLMVCRNPLLAAERARTREALLQATEADIRAVEAATRREKRRLTGEPAITRRLDRVLSRRKMRKHFDTAVRDDGFTWTRNADSIAAEAALDGFYIVRTNLPASTLAADDTVRAYKSLAGVERAFRTLKTIDLKVRPVHHRLADRVRAHVLLCTLAWYVEWHMRDALKPLLFHDEAPPRQASAVAPAQPSDQAKAKAATRLTTSGLPVQNFKSLIKHLATLVKMQMTPASETVAHFQMLSRPTAVQEEAFRLLGLRIS